MSDEFDWGTLEDHVSPGGEFTPPARKPASGPDAKTVRFPCQGCNGTGKWRGGVNNAGAGHCFACGGKGYFLTSERDRAKARQDNRDRKAKRAVEAAQAFELANPGMAAFLASAAQWSGFAASLLEKLSKYGSLSDNQIAAVRSMQAKCEARRAERAAERLQARHNAVEVDLSPIRRMFEQAHQSGYKRPVYRAADLILSRAPDTGKNPGAIYVKRADGGDDGNGYLGKLVGTSYQGKPDAHAALAAIAADPRGEAIRYGQRTGQCSCCGRELTAEASISAGIGPICASKWGL